MPTNDAHEAIVLADPSRVLSRYHYRPAEKRLAVRISLLHVWRTGDHEAYRWSLLLLRLSSCPGSYDVLSLLFRTLPFFAFLLVRFRCVIGQGQGTPSKKHPSRDLGPFLPLARFLLGVFLGHGITT
jgi:hypothetical protein